MVTGQVTASKEWWDDWIKKVIVIFSRHSWNETDIPWLLQDGNIEAIPIRNNGGFALYQAVKMILPKKQNRANGNFAFDTHLVAAIGQDDTYFPSIGKDYSGSPAYGKWQIVSVPGSSTYQLTKGASPGLVLDIEGGTSSA